MAERNIKIIYKEKIGQGPPPASSTKLRIICRNVRGGGIGEVFEIKENQFVKIYADEGGGCLITLEEIPKNDPAIATARAHSDEEE